MVTPSAAIGHREGAVHHTVTVGILLTTAVWDVKVGPARALGLRPHPRPHFQPHPQLPALAPPGVLLRKTEIVALQTTIPFAAIGRQEGAAHHTGTVEIILIIVEPDVKVGHV